MEILSKTAYTVESNQERQSIHMVMVIANLVCSSKEVIKPFSLFSLNFLRTLVFFISSALCFKTSVDPLHLHAISVACLLVCMSVLARNILCPRPCCLCSYVCNGLPRQAHPPKVKYSLSAHTNKGKANGVRAIRQNISLWEGVLVLEDHYIHMNRENKALDTEYF